MLLSTSAASILSSFLNDASAQAAEQNIDETFLEPTIPFSSRRQYKAIQLNNGLRVVIVSDRKAFRASAALSIQGAGQFDEPPQVPGLAHLLEHMTLSSSREDFEAWLEDREGASNAFTAPGSVCFHFNSPPEVFGEALERFASLFVQETVERVCRNPVVLKREIRRVDSELDYTSEATQAFYLLKDFVSPDHPFARFGAGNLESLEKSPNKNSIDVSAELIDFFRSRYLPSKAVLVVVCPTDLSVLDRWTTFVFSNALSRRPAEDAQENELQFPYAFPSRSRPTQIVLYRPKGESQFTEKSEKLSIKWPLQLNYNKDSPVITVSAVGFVVSQIVARRGPGSLYLFLLRRGWVPKGNQGLPRITFPVDVSGFQIMKLEIQVTLDGFANRSAIVAAVYDSLRAVRRISQPEESFLLPQSLLNQYLTVARLHGYALAPRPPDAVELATDVQMYGLDTVTYPGAWPIIPRMEDTRAIQNLREAVADTLKLMSNPSKGIVFITASNKAIQRSGRSIVDETLPPLSSERWLVEPTTGARYYREDRTKLPGYVEEWIAAKLDEDELLPPSYNPLIPAKLRNPRPVLERKSIDGGRRLYYLEAPESKTASVAGGEYTRDSVWREFTTLTSDRQADRTGSVSGTWEDRAVNSIVGSDWRLWQAFASSDDMPKLPLPVGPSEPTCRCAFVLQLLSPRPARANVKQAAHAQLWLMSFENAVSDLVSDRCMYMFAKYSLLICNLILIFSRPNWEPQLG
jgi:insulysin